MLRTVFSIASCVVLMTGTAKAESPTVVIETSMGVIKIELDQDKAPISVKNFLDYVDAKHYDGTLFHRVISRENSNADFVIQGGGYEPGMKEKKTKDPIANESANGLKNKKHTIAMARKAGQPNSASAQFFINLADNAHLDPEQSRDGFGSSVFGRVVEGTDVIDKIKAVKTSAKGVHSNVPIDDVVIKSIRRTEEKKQ